MTVRTRWTTLLVVITSFWLVAVEGGRAQLMPFTSGQNVQPVFEGWEKNSDGTFSLWFGYMNRNFVEQPNVEIGAANTIEPGGPDQGQPTHFYPRRMQFVFNVKVPADWGKKDLVWTVTAHGRTDKAIGTLLPQWEVDKEMMVKNINTQDDLIRVNDDKPPTLAVDPVSAARFPGPVTLAGTVVDPDNMPKPNVGPPRGRGGRGQNVRNAPTYPPGPTQLREGLSLGWIQYRGPGQVTFTPPGFVRVEGGQKAVRQATFSEPGTYVLRAIGSDSWLFVMKDLTVVVSAGGSQH